jgi:DNA-binding CsgD family transcriptional regulator/pimeloyl-ACP methyl ester carboxylesterase
MEPPPVQYVRTSDGVSIAFTVAGSGRTLVHMPWAWNHVQLYWLPGSTYRHVSEQFVSQFRVVHYDCRGSGLSSRGLPETHSMADYEHDLEAVIGRAAPEKFILLAPGFSGHPAVRYVVSHPERIEALILWSCRVRGVWGEVLGDLYLRDWDAFVDVSARSALEGDDAAQAKRVFREAITQADWIRRNAAAAASSIESAAPRLKVATLILAPSNSALAFGLEDHAKQLAALIPDSRLVLFDDAAGIGTPTTGSPAFTAIMAFLADLVPNERGSTVQVNDNGLSAREVEVLRLIAAGKSNPQIAEALVISINTVQRHVSNILAKTGAANRTEAAGHARDRGSV